MSKRRQSSLLAVVFACACGSSSGADTRTESEADSGTSTSSPGDLSGGIVVDAGWLQQHLGNSGLQVIDSRFDPGTEHIPGALHIQPLAIAATVDGIDAQIMPAAQAQGVLAGAGLRNDTTVVVYGAPPEYDPARIVWALHYYGHRDVRYLDGGWEAWLAANGDVESGAIEPTASEYVIVETDEQIRVDGDFVLAQLGDPPYTAPAIGLVDARSPEEWDAGRIPSAPHVQWTRTLDGGGRLLPPAELESLYSELDRTGTIVTYCLVGWRASVAWLSLRHLGYQDVRVYDGSWAEWTTLAFPTEP